MLSESDQARFQVLTTAIQFDGAFRHVHLHLVGILIMFSLINR